MAIVRRTFILTGGRKGRTCKLKVGTKFVEFVNGELTLEGNSQDMDGYEKYLGRSFAAYPKDSIELHRALEGETPHGKRDIYEDEIYKGTGTVSSKVQSEGNEITQVPPDVKPGTTSGGTTGTQHVPPRDGHQDTRVHQNPLNEQQQSILKTINSLDPEKDENWTVQGLPQTQVVEQASGVHGLTRKVVEEIAPGYNRDKAKELLQEQNENQANK